MTRYWSCKIPNFPLKPLEIFAKIFHLLTVVESPEKLTCNVHKISTVVATPTTHPEFNYNLRLHSEIQIIKSVNQREIESSRISNYIRK